MDEIEELGELANAHTAELLVVQAMIKALIATHPHPEAVEATFQVGLSAMQSALPDAMFSAGQPVGMSSRMQQRLQLAARPYLAFFPPRPASPGAARGG